MGFADCLGLRIGRVIEPRKPNLLDLQSAKNGFAVNEAAEVVVMLVRPDHNIERFAGQGFGDFRGDRF